MKIARRIKSGVFGEGVEVGAELACVGFVGAKNQRLFAQRFANCGDPVGLVHTGKAKQAQRRSAGLQIVAEPFEFTAFF